MTGLLLVRHGETDWNAAQVFRGRADIELNEAGYRQAELLAEHLANREVAAVYSSPLKRALRTAEAIARRHRLEVEIAPGLADIDFGEWQGLAAQEVKYRYADLYARWLERPHRVKLPGGESLDVIRRRATGVVNEAASRHEGTVVLVSHRVVNKVLICALLGLNTSHFWSIKQDVGGVTTFACENGRFILTGHNDTCYLKDMPHARLSDF